MAEAPCFERVGEEFNPETGTGGIEIWIPVAG
jgi:predicted transcriptional regulator YdeE